MHNADTDAPARSNFGRATTSLTAAATIAVAPLADVALGSAGSGQSAHSIPVYLMARVAHDIGHNDWAFQGGNAGRVGWVVSYVALALFWLGVAVWMRVRARGERPVNRLWLWVLAATWGTEFVTAALTGGAGLLAAHLSLSLDPILLHFADLCSPWWACVAAVLVVARAERSTLALRAAIGYGVLLAIVLTVPLPGPDAVKALILALPAAVPALMTPRQQQPTSVATPDAAVAG